MHEEIVYFPPPAAGTTPAVMTVTSGISWCDGSYRISRRDSDKYVFEYVVSGTGFIDCPAGRFTLAAGDAYILPIHTSYTYGSSSADPWVKIWFNARGRLIGELLDCYGLTNVWRIPGCHLETLFREEREKLIRSPEKAHSMIGLTIHRIVAALSEKIEARKPLPASEEGLRLKRYIDDRLLEPLSLAGLAGEINRSVSQTVRIFRRDWGVTPYRYFLDKRLELARIYLHDTVRPVKEIAAELNFADEYYFANMFKRKTGTSPGAYRKAGRD